MLMQAVRTVFNIAIGADSADLQRTARSALLQMLNTVVKRITMATVVRAASCLSSCLPAAEGANRICRHAVSVHRFVGIFEAPCMP